MLGVDARNIIVGSVTATGTDFGRVGNLGLSVEPAADSSSSEESKREDNFPDLTLSLGDLSPKLELLPWRCSSDRVPFAASELGMRSSKMLKPSSPAAVGVVLKVDDCVRATLVGSSGSAVM
jgi:hypothetical protein